MTTPPPYRHRRMGYIALNVSDLDKTTRFATEVFALDLAGEHAGGGRFFRSGPKHHDVLLTQADGPAFVRAGLELESEQELERAFAHYETLGWKPAWVSDKESADLFVERAFRVREPVCGVCWEYFSRMTYVSVPVKNKVTSFKEFGHFGLWVPDCKAISRSMCDHMGFAVSDYLEGWRISLLRAQPNANHHTFAPVGSPLGKLGFHHLAFMVNSIDDIGLLFNRIKRYDVKIQFGIGRHPTSGSIHLYIYDPDHMVWEYTLGMEQFPELNPREPRRMSAQPENFDLWGATPDPDTIKHHVPVLTG